MAPRSPQEMLEAFREVSKQQRKTGGTVNNDALRASLLAIGRKRSGDKTAGSRNALDSRIAAILQSDAPD